MICLNILFFTVDLKTPFFEICKQFANKLMVNQKSLSIYLQIFFRENQRTLFILIKVKNFIPVLYLDLRNLLTSFYKEAQQKIICQA